MANHYNWLGLGYAPTDSNNEVLDDLLKTDPSDPLMDDSYDAEDIQYNLERFANWATGKGGVAEEVYYGDCD